LLGNKGCGGQFGDINRMVRLFNISGHHDEELVAMRSRREFVTKQNFLLCEILLYGYRAETRTETFLEMGKYVEPYKI
jgi:hypothetical protein